ncbi:MAG: hypothetical protein ACJ77Z_12135 [Thermoleophilaceae bacterium]
MSKRGATRRVAARAVTTFPEHAASGKIIAGGRKGRALPLAACATINEKDWPRSNPARL